MKGYIFQVVSRENKVIDNIYLDYETKFKGIADKVRQYKKDFIDCRIYIYKLNSDSLTFLFD